MRPSLWLFSFRLASLVGLAVSVMVLIDYSTPEMAFCSSTSGCGAVRDSGFGFVVLPSGQPVPYLPILGVLAFAGLFAASLLRSASVRSIVAGTLALSGGTVGIALLGVQAFVVGHFCSLCLIVDSAAIVAGVAQLGLRRAGWEAVTAVENGASPAARGDLLLRPSAWLALVTLAILAPLAFKSVARTQTLPAGIAALHHPERVTVVEFFDYQCPHCRLALPELDKALAAFKQPVHVVRQPIGLPGHPLGLEAARLHVCAGEQLASEQVLHVLMAGGPLLTEQQFAQIDELPLNREQLRTCLDSPRPKEVLDGYLKRIQDAEFLGLPTIYIGHTRILGGAPYEVYLDALEDAAAGRDRSGIPPLAYWLLTGLLAGLFVWLGRVRLGGAEAPASAA